MTTRWQDIDPKDATSIDLTKRLDITAPLNEMGERCPWPWDPQQLVGAPLGQYHCPYCGAMVMAGMEHLDYFPTDPREGWQCIHGVKVWRGHECGTCEEIGVYEWEHPRDG